MTIAIQKTTRATQTLKMPNCRTTTSPTQLLDTKTLSCNTNSPLCTETCLFTQISQTTLNSALKLAYLHKWYNKLMNLPNWQLTGKLLASSWRTLGGLLADSWRTLGGIILTLQTVLGSRLRRWRTLGGLLADSWRNHSDPDSGSAHPILCFKLSYSFFCFWICVDFISMQNDIFSWLRVR